MKKSRKKQEYVQTDILAALRGVDLIVKEKEEKIEELTKKTLTPWNFVEDILFLKKGNLLDDDENIKLFVPYIVLRWLSMMDKKEILYYVNAFDKYSGILTKKQIYDGLVALIPQQRKTFIKYTKLKDEDIQDEIIRCCNFFECSTEEFKEFINIMGVDWFNKLKYKFGDMI